MASETTSFRPKDHITFRTPQGRVLTGKIQFMGDWIALVKVSKPRLSILVDTSLPTCQRAVS